MVGTRLGDVRRFVGNLLSSRNGESLPDGQLLDRYVTGRDEDAFTALVQRYGPLVLGVCNRVLHNAQEVEDAFQATFFVLARRADSLDGTGTLANWLYTVAYRTAVKARIHEARRLAHERQVREMRAVSSPAEEAQWDEIRPLLDEELSRMPEKYRAPLILCCLEGMSHQDAARALGWPSGSMSRRMNRARELLRQRLARRGVVLSGGLLLLLFLQRAKAAAAVPPALASVTAKAAVIFGAQGVTTAVLSSSRVAGLAQEILKTSVKAGITKSIGTGLLALVLLGLIGTTATFATRQVIGMIYPPNQACGTGQGGGESNAEPGR